MLWKQQAMICFYFLAALVLLVPSVKSQQCPPSGFDALKPDAFDSNKFVGSSWYSLKQLPVAYQPVSQLYCVSADYAIIEQSGPGFIGSVWCNTVGAIFGGCADALPAISVFNSARVGSVNGAFNSIEFTATIPDQANDPAKALVAPGFIPDTLRGSETNYWVVKAGSYSELNGVTAEEETSFYQWAIITTGPPDVEGPTEGQCYSAGGYWYFSRERQPPPGVEEALDSIATDLGLDTAVMKLVEQENCSDDTENFVTRTIGGIADTLDSIGASLP